MIKQNKKSSNNEDVDKKTTSKVNKGIVSYFKKIFLHESNPNHIFHKPIELKHLFYTLVITVALSIFTVSFLMTPFRLSGYSMYDTLVQEEMLIIDMITHKIYDDLKRGEIIVVKTEKSELDAPYVKRIIGMPGDEIRIMNDYVFIFNNEFPKGKLIQEPYTDGNKTLAKRAGDTFYLLGDEYLVMGDNRENSEDGRDWGPIDKSQIIGRVMYKIWWPMPLKRHVYTELGDVDDTLVTDVKNKIDDVIDETKEVVKDTKRVVRDTKRAVKNNL